MKSYNIMFLVALCLAVLIMSSPTTAVNDTRIGCEKHNATTLMCWNNGSIEQVTYFTWNSEGLQIANNNTGRFDWVSYDHGLLYYQGGSPVILSFKDLPNLSVSWRSDNSSYYLINFSTVLRQGAKRAYVEYSAGQLLNDDYVNFTLKFSTISGFYGWNKTVSLWRSMKRIDLDLDNDTDIINYDSGWFWYNGSNVTRRMSEWLNKSAMYYDNITGKKFHIGDMDSVDSSAVRWHWNDNRIRNLWLVPSNPSEPNNKVYWMRPTKSPVVQNGRSYELSEFWIDIPECSESCSPGLSYYDSYFYCNTTWSQAVCEPYPGSVIVPFMIGLVYVGMGGTCSHTEGCVHRVETNESGSGWQEVLNDVPLPNSMSVCLNETFEECKQDEIYLFAGSFYLTHDFQIICAKEGNRSLRGNYTVHDDGTANNIKMVCNADEHNPYISSETANASVFYEGDTIVLECNFSDDYPMYLAQMYDNWTFPGIYIPALSNDVRFNQEYWMQRNVTGLGVGFYKWKCWGMDNNLNINQTVDHVFWVRARARPVINYSEVNLSAYVCGGSHQVDLVSLCSHGGGASCWQNDSGDVRCWDLNSSNTSPDVIINYTFASNCTGSDWPTGYTCNYSLDASDFDYCGNISCLWTASDGNISAEATSNASLLIDRITPQITKKGLQIHQVLLLLGLMAVMIYFASKYRASYYWYLAGTIAIITGLAIINSGIVIGVGEQVLQYRCMTCVGEARVLENAWQTYEYSNHLGVCTLLVGLVLLITPLRNKKKRK